VQFPLLADFHPKGEVGKRYDAHLAQAGIDDRATVIIDAGGVVRYAVSVTPSGERDIDALCREVESIAAAYEDELPAANAPPGIPQGTTLYVKNNCAASRAAMAARINLHIESQVALKNVTEVPAALAELESLTGKKQAPCLVIDGEPKLESQDIIRDLVTRATGIWT